MNPPTNQDAKTVDEILATYADNHRNHAYDFDNSEITQIQYFKTMIDDRDEAKQALLTLLDNQVIGEDEKHYNGRVMVNDPGICIDCTNPDERFARNQLRAKQRQALYQVFNITPPSKER